MNQVCGDDILYTVVSTTYESNILDPSYSEEIFENIIKFNNEHQCKLYLIWLGESYEDVKAGLYKPNYDINAWEYLGTEVSNDDCDLLLIINNYLESHDELNQVSSFIVFKDIQENINSRNVYNGHNALRILSDIQDLDFCHIWSPYYIDFNNLRKYNMIYTHYDAEGG